MVLYILLLRALFNALVPDCSLRLNVRTESLVGCGASDIKEGRSPASRQSTRDRHRVRAGSVQALAATVHSVRCGQSRNVEETCAA
jgi:hypothetical protein